MCIPLLVAQTVIGGRWIFGDAMCKLYYTVESINKVLSTFLLMAVSIDRYLVICHGRKATVKVNNISLSFARAPTCLLYESTALDDFIRRKHARRFPFGNTLSS